MSSSVSSRALLIILLLAIGYFASLGNTPQTFAADLRARGVVTRAAYAYNSYGVVGTAVNVRLSLSDGRSLDEPVVKPSSSSARFDPVSVGDSVEAFGDQQSPTDFVYRLVLQRSDHYLIRLTGSTGQLLSVDVYTPRGGRGSNTYGGSFTVGESFPIYIDLNKAALLKLTVTYSDGRVEVVGPSSTNAGTKSVGFRADPQDVGTVTFIAEAWAGSEYASDRTWIMVTPAVSTLSVSISGTPTSGQAPLEVSFFSTVTGGRAPYQYFWDFGDGSTSGESNPRKTYTNQGTYVVRLTVTDSAGNRQTSNSLQISLTSGPRCGGFSLSLVNRHDSDKLGTFIQHMMPGGVPYPIDVDVTLTVPSELSVRSAMIRLSGATPEYVDLLSMGAGRYYAELRATRPLAIAEIGRIITFVVGLILKIPGFGDFADLPFESPPLQVYITEIDVTLSNGQKCPSVSRYDYVPTYLDALKKIPGLGSIFYAGSPVDLLVVDDNGRRVGSMYNNGIYVQDVNEIPGAFYVGHQFVPSFIYVPAGDGRFKVEVSGYASGSYHLAFGTANGDKSDSVQFKESIKSGAVKEYWVEIRTGSISTSGQTAGIFDNETFVLIASAVGFAAIAATAGVFLYRLRSQRVGARLVRRGGAEEGAARLILGGRMSNAHPRDKLIRRRRGGTDS